MIELSKYSSLTLIVHKFNSTEMFIYEWTDEGVDG